MPHFMMYTANGTPKEAAYSITESADWLPGLFPGLRLYGLKVHKEFALIIEVVFILVIYLRCSVHQPEGILPILMIAAMCFLSFL